MLTYASHFHRIPSGSFTHHITIKGVQDTLVRQLQRVIKHHSLLGIIYLTIIGSLNKLGEIF